MCFESNLLAGVLGLCLVSGFASGCADVPSSSRRPNVVLISIDSLRQDMVSAYGYESPHAPGVASSPTLDALAEQGVLFENAYATTSWTLPSHLTMLTGQPELVHGVDIDYHVPDPGRPLLAERLRQVGYRTAGFFSGPYLEPHFGFDRGFDTYEACYGPELTAASRRKAAARAALDDAQIVGAGPARLALLSEQLSTASRSVEQLSHRDRSSATVADRACEAIASAAQSGQPLFLFAHLFDPHYDYVPPAPFDTRFDPDYSGEVTGEEFLGNPLLSAPRPTYDEPGRRERVAGERDVEHVRALYAGELAWADSQIARIVEALDAAGLREDTVLIVTADHGDEFFEHGSLGHRHTLFEEITRIPLIVSWPAELPQGRREPGLVSNADLVPTVLEWLGLGGDVNGRSFAALIEGEEEERFVAARMVRAWPMSYPNLAPKPVRGDLLIVTETFRQGSIKITRQRRWPRVPLERVAPAARKEFLASQAASRAREELFWVDLERHPEERRRDRSRDFGSGPARDALAAFRATYGEWLQDRRESSTVRDNSELIEMLRANGYVEDDGIDPDTLPMAPGEFVLPPPGE